MVNQTRLLWLSTVLILCATFALVALLVDVLG